MKRFVVFLLFLLCATSFSFASGVHKKVLMIIAHENFRDEELFVTKRVLEACGAKVDVVSNEKGVAKGMLGATFNVKHRYDEVNWDQYQVVVLVGGSGATVFWQDTTLQDLLRKAYNKGKIVAAICLSPVTLAKAGILKGRKATCWIGASRLLREHGVIYTGNPVEVYGRVVTAAGPFAAEEFGRVICKLLGYK
ncbi:protease I [Thermosulfidibacter takaii ABI70S6]|uniref:Protease I n=1 Tax=Thermosulfidibacter takaii (strain DSM 17441 / JCM 13301 / NBRC 103674 / ABI70S6) TaxID=1298851 RepID=A0A0S3QVY3_THET7|nr:DJ-1/PfpI family protein [Thermosulfidibacter takaii]BAT72493.1 protease I [Thermosulfidibacter takaii ABI70S6]